MRGIENSQKKSSRFPIFNTFSRFRTRLKRRVKLFIANVKAFFRAVWVVFKMLRLALLILIILAVLLRVFTSNG